MENPSCDLIVAAVGGDEEAMDEILRHYEPMINEQCGGNEIMHRQVTEALREAILHYDLSDLAKNEAYLRENYPDEAE